MCVVFKAFDRDVDSFVNMEEWIRGLSVFLRGSLEEHVKCMHSFLSTQCLFVFVLISPLLLLHFGLDL